MQKTFDRVSIDGIIYQVFNKYLKYKIIEAGVLQEYILGSRIYTLYVNDQPVFPKSNIAVYADNRAIYTQSHYSSVTAKQLQIHIQMLFVPSFKTQKLDLNTGKTKIINFTKKFTNNNIYTNVTAEQQEIIATKAVNYLGVTLGDKLIYRNHLRAVIQRGYIALGYLYPLIESDKLNIKTKVLMYKTLAMQGPFRNTQLRHRAEQHQLTYVRKMQVFENKYLRLRPIHSFRKILH